MPEQITPVALPNLAAPSPQLLKPLDAHTLTHEFPLYDNKTELSDDILKLDGVEPSLTSNSESVDARVSKIHKLSRSIGARAVTEVVGMGVDIGLMAAGGAGISPFSSVIGRETTASTIDVGLMNKLTSSHNKQETPASKSRRLGHFALAMATAVTAQKLGPDVVSHISANIDHGIIGHFGVPLASKIGATAGVNSLAKRVLA